MRLPAATAAGGARRAPCAAGMDSPCKGIFFSLRDLLMGWLQRAAVRGAAAGGKAMTERTAHETWESRVGRREPACRRPPNGGGSPFVQRKKGLGRGLRVRRAALSRTKCLDSTRCAGLPAAWGCTERGPITRDNCLYRALSCQYSFARAAIRAARRSRGCAPESLQPIDGRGFSETRRRRTGQVRSAAGNIGAADYCAR